MNSSAYSENAVPPATMYESGRTLRMSSIARSCGAKSSSMEPGRATLMLRSEMPTTLGL